MLPTKMAKSQVRRSAGSELYSSPIDKMRTVVTIVVNQRHDSTEESDVNSTYKLRSRGHMHNICSKGHSKPSTFSLLRSS